MNDTALFVVNSAKFFLSHRVPVARAAQALGLDVHVAAPATTEEARIREAGFGFCPIEMQRRSIAPWTELNTLRSLTALYRQLRPRLVHHVTLKSVLYGSWAARLVGVPAVINAVTGLGYLFSSQTTKARVARAAFVAVARPILSKGRSTTIFQNREDMAEFLKLGLASARDSVLIRGSGVDTSVFRPSPMPAGTPLVVLPSRMLWDKGVGVFVEAADLLRREGVGVRLALVGEPDAGNPHSVTSEVLQRWKSSGSVEVWGHRADMQNVFAESAIVALPSQYGEGVPKVLIEAASCGRPVVTTDVPGCRDIVRHGENGLIVPPRDPRRLADAIATLARDLPLRVRMGERGRAIVELEYSQELVVAKTMAIYQQALAQASASNWGVTSA